jgi:hypothetical protein
MWAADPKQQFPPWVGIPFFIVWCWLMGSFLYSYWRVVPRALDRWAKEQGFKVIRKSPGGPFKMMAMGASSSQVVYSIVVVDAKGATRSGLVKIGDYWWFSLSLDRCPIEVRWDETRKIPNLWDREVDGY